MKKISLLFLVSILASGLSVPAQTNADTLHAAAEKALQAGLDSLTNHSGIPGVTFAALYADGTGLSLASGYADTESRQPMPPDAVMFSGSVGKTYVAAVVLKLASMGSIRLDARAVEYLEGENWFSKVPNSGEISVEMLLNHTAGVPEYVYHKELWEQIRQNPGKAWSVEERMSFIYKDSPPNTPGAGWSYADSHYIILGLIIEKVTGKNYYAVLDELILQPCRLTRTKPADHRSIDGLVAGYTNLTDELLLPAKMLAGGQYAFNPQLEWTGGGLVTTVTDLARWAMQLYGGTVLPSDLKKKMLTPVPFPTSLPGKSAYGLGCIIGETGGVTWYGHTGFVPGYITIMQYIPSAGLSLAMQLNSDNLHGKAAKEVFDRLKMKVLVAGEGQKP